MPSRTPKIRCARWRRTQDMGYITIGDKIDPNDWRDDPRRTPKQIVADVLAHLPPCAPNDTRCGNIILLHDGGGNREQTVLALPTNYRRRPRPGIPDRSALRVAGQDAGRSHAAYSFQSALGRRA